MWLTFRIHFQTTCQRFTLPRHLLQLFTKSTYFYITKLAIISFIAENDSYYSINILNIRATSD